jgi:spore maturation protein CgeB
MRSCAAMATVPKSYTASWKRDPTMAPWGVKPSTSTTKRSCGGRLRSQEAATDHGQDELVINASCESKQVLIVGIDQAGSVGTHLFQAALSRDQRVRLLCSEQGYSPSRLLRSVGLRLFGGLPSRGGRFNAAIRTLLARERPDVLLTTGASAVFGETLVDARRLGVTSINYSTDDPWSVRHASRWYFRALKQYDAVATPRADTIPDFHRLGVGRVARVPFGYCPKAHAPAEGIVEDLFAGDVFFAGGCDRDRLRFFREIVKAGLRPILYGAYWDRHADLRRFHRGFASLGEMATLHARTPVSVCLVRRSNRDDHVMRTYEAASMGACLAMEDTPAHRKLFGADEERVIYFRDPESLVTACQRLLGDLSLRQRLRVAARQVVVNGRNTYADRLDQMLALATGS